jgi:hypothetical protein
MPVIPMVSWHQVKDDPGVWELKVIGRGTAVATVYPDGVWSTWDRNGTGGENSKEASVSEAKTMAAGRAIAQGFI